MAIHQPSGGIPANDAKKIVINTPRPGAYENKPPKLLISPLRVVRDAAMTTANIPRFMAAYTIMYTTTDCRAGPAASPVQATASGIKMKPPWLILE